MNQLTQTRGLKSSPITPQDEPFIITKANKSAEDGKKAFVRNPLYRQFDFRFVRGMGATTVVTYKQMRNLAAANPIVKLAIRRIKQEIVKTPFIVRAKSEDQTGQLKPYIDRVYNLLMHPNSNDDTFRTVFLKVLDDILTLDNGVIEKVRNARGDIVELYHVDGATIFPCINDHGLYEDPAYKQYLDGNYQSSVDAAAEFAMNEIMMFQASPSPQMEKTGYGESPLEEVITTVITGINAFLFNADFFDSSKLPPAIINLKGIDADAIVAFKNGFESQLQGKPWSNAYTNAEALDVKTLRGTNLEMQFYELNLWLARIIFGAYGLSPQEFGFTMDVNKATAESQERITEGGGYSTYRDVIAEEINNDLIGDLAQEDENYNLIEFAWDVDESLDPKVQADIDQIYVNMGKTTVDELRARDGEKPLTPEQKVEFGNKPTSPLDQLFGIRKSHDHDHDADFDKLLKPKNWVAYYL